MTEGGDRKGHPWLLAADLGGTWLRLAAFDAAGQLGERHRVATPTGAGPEAVVAAICDLAMAASDGGSPPLVIGVPGPVDPDSGVVLGAPNLPGWREVPLRSLLERGLGRSCRVEHDAALAALGEHRRGAGRGTANFAYVTVSTGIGAGLIFGGRLYRGSQGTAGEFGHFVVDPHGPICHCGNRGCLEAVASGTGIAALAGRSSAAEVAAAAEGGDQRACAVLSDAAHYLGRALGGLLNLLNLDAIALGGGVFNAGHSFWSETLTAVAEGSFAAPREHASIVPAQLGGDAGLLGAFELARDSDRPQIGRD